MDYEIGQTVQVRFIKGKTSFGGGIERVAYGVIERVGKRISVRSRNVFNEALGQPVTLPEDCD